MGLSDRDYMHERGPVTHDGNRVAGQVFIALLGRRCPTGIALAGSGQRPNLALPLIRNRSA
jgi:hypothetical protein